jgi:hypothetical protein
MDMVQDKCNKHTVQNHSTCVVQKKKTQQHMRVQAVETENLLHQMGLELGLVQPDKDVSHKPCHISQIFMVSRLSCHCLVLADDAPPPPTPIQQHKWFL